MSDNNKIGLGVVKFLLFLLLIIQCNTSYNIERISDDIHKLVTEPDTIYVEIVDD